MDEATKHLLVQQLGREMSDISEDCYCAGWLGGTEYMVPELCRRAIEMGLTQHWGHGEVTLEQARQLWGLAERIEGWAENDLDCIGYVLFLQPIPHAPWIHRGHRAGAIISPCSVSKREGSAEQGAAA